MQTQNEDKCMGSKEVAHYINKHPNTLARWVKEGIFPKGKKVGKTRIWKKSVIDKFLDD